MIYFIQEGTDGPIKVGYATDVRSRLAQLQTGNFRRLKILGCWHVDWKPTAKELRDGCDYHWANKIIEGKFHGALEPCRIAGEWYDPKIISQECYKEFIQWIKENTSHEYKPIHKYGTAGESRSLEQLQQVQRLIDFNSEYVFDGRK